jgi:hypothetical protein
MGTDKAADVKLRNSRIESLKSIGGYILNEKIKSTSN